MLRVAIVGVSGYGAILTDLLSSFAAEGKVRFVAATVVNRAQQSARCDLLERQNVRVFDDYREMFSASGPAIDLCLVPVGIPWHASVAIAALEAGCHVLVEKPLAGDYADAGRIEQAARKTGKQLFVGFQDLCDPGVWEIKEALLGKRIGEITEIRASGAWPRPVGYFERNEWAGKVTLDGVAVHDVPWNPAAGKFICPCHGSQYDEAGKVVRGPAPLSLALAHVQVDNDQVLLSPWSETDFRDGSQPWWA
jgi:predicted dehydrogenase